MRRVATVLTVMLLTGAGAASAQSCEPAEMAVQVLGSGGPRINRDRASTSYLVWLGGRGRVLVDVGGGAFLRFGQAGGRLDDLALVAISHAHPDHVSDLPALLWLSNLARREPLPIAGPTGNEVAPDIQTFLRRLFDDRTGAFPLLGGTLRGAGLGVPLEITAVDVLKAEPTVVFEGDGISVTALGVPHGNVPSVAYKVHAAGMSVVFSSDQTGTNPNFVEFARAADILVMHLEIGAGATSPLHASPETVGRVARQAGVRHLVLSHIGQIDLDAAVAAVTQHFSGRVTVGADLRCASAR